MTTYADYLRSDAWQEIRRQAAERSQGLCELCKAAGTETHHVRYPRGYANDSVDNVLHVCSACHRRSHGMNQLITDRSLRSVQITTFKGRQGEVFVDERRWVWASWAQWGRVLVIPTPLQAQLMSRVKAGAIELKREHSEPYELHDPKGEPWFRWHPVIEALDGWSHRLRDRIGRGDATRGLSDNDMTDDERLLYGNVRAIRRWGNDVIERELESAMGTAVAKGGTDNAGALAQAMTLLAGVSQDHEHRLQVVEHKVTRDPDEYLDAKSCVIECGIASDRCVHGTKLTVQQWLGMEMKKSGAHRGPLVMTRIEGTSRTVEVGTYRRRDLLAVLARLPKA